MLGFEITLSMFVELFCREVKENHWNMQKTKWMKFNLIHFFGT